MGRLEKSSLRITTVTTLAALVVLAGFSAAGWPGETNGCFEEQRPTCFCETPREGWVAQPANTFSNAGFIAVGLLIAAAADHRLGWFARNRNPITDERFYAVIFAVVTALLGPGSMALHGSMTHAGGQVDVASMYFYAGLIVAYGVVRLRGLSEKRFAVLYAVIVLVLVGTKLADVIPVEPAFGALLLATGAIEVWLARRRPFVLIQKVWGVLAVVLFLCAFAVWLPSRSGGAWCSPESWLQGHAVWHLLCAAAAGSMFLYYLSEDAGTAAKIS